MKLDAALHRFEVHVSRSLKEYFSEMSLLLAQLSDQLSAAWDRQDGGGDLGTNAATKILPLHMLKLAVPLRSDEAPAKACRNVYKLRGEQLQLLMKEIVNIYPSINPPTLTAHQSNRVCNALALLQCVASHPETRSAFLAAHIPLFLYPFLHTVSKTRPFEYLRLTSLGVIGALVKTDEQEVINFLLTTEIIPLCLRIMESGSELSKTVATFILQKILLDDTGLAYICQTYERFSHVAMILGKMVLQLSKEPSARLLKHVVRCYLRLSDNPRAREALRQCLPDQLKDTTFAQVLKDDTTTKRWLAQLVKNLQEGQVTDPRGIPLPPQ
ncbi:CCR4-NOT transcription complex subunit 9 [Bombina bombina]|uniref:CCR4-NOT transcription complex subunit 9 n=1 Tax=Bombina bombina TaxID=8345 RepID=UPI00235A8ABB|nr:CCR4-NOT transcription complex subunit 9 [Bombina bombina]